MVEFEFSATSRTLPANRQVDLYQPLRAPPCRQAPVEESPQLIEIPAVIGPPARPDAGAKRGSAVRPLYSGMGVARHPSC